MKTLASVAHGMSDNLLTRSADVTLKERRRLVLMVRETPFNLAHLRNMTAATEMGAVIFPPLPAFYHKPQSVDELVNDTVEDALPLQVADVRLCLVGGRRTGKEPLEYLVRIPLGGDGRARVGVVDRHASVVAEGERRNAGLLTEMAGGHLVHRNGIATGHPRHAEEIDRCQVAHRILGVADDRAPRKRSLVEQTTQDADIVLEGQERFERAERLDLCRNLAAFNLAERVADIGEFL
jgi:hypothetical protein